jgi:hypothetical protein
MGAWHQVREDQIQRTVFQHLRQRPAPGVFAFHPKNGGIHQRGRRRGINAGLGVVSGVPDIIAIKQGSVYALELKADDGKPSAAQIATLQAMQAAGVTVALATGLNAAIRKIEEWGLVRGGAT